MTLFNIFGVYTYILYYMWSKGGREWESTSGWLASGWWQRRNISFFVCSLPSYLQNSFSIRTSPYAHFDRRNAIWSLWTCVSTCAVCSERCQKWCICWRWVTMTMILYDGRRTRKKKRNKVNGVANGQKEIDLKLQHIVREMDVRVRLIWFGGGDSLTHTLLASLHTGLYCFGP